MLTELLKPTQAARFLNNRAQAAFLEDRSRFRAAVAGIGGGKSEVAGYEIVRHMLAYPGIEALVAAPSYPMIYRSGGPEDVIKRVARWWGTGRDGEPTLISGQNRTADWIEFANGSRVWFCYAANPDSIRGAEVSLFWLDEAAMCEERAFQVLIGRCRQAGKYPHRGWITTTPRGRNWVYTQFVHGRDEWTPERLAEYGYHHWTTYDNPGQRPDDLAAMAEAYGKGTDFYRQEMLAEFVAFAGLVYSMFDYEAHVVELAPPLKQLVRVVAGVDWGVTHPGCIAVCGVDCEGIHWWLDEAYARGRMTHGETGRDWLSEAIRLQQKWGITRFYCDPADANARLAWARAGLPVTPANNARLPGIRQVQSLIAGDRLRVVGPACGATLSELGQYHWRTDADGNPLEDADPAKEFDDALDARRYAEMGLAGGETAATVGISGNAWQASW